MKGERNKKRRSGGNELGERGGNIGGDQASLEKIAPGNAQFRIKEKEVGATGFTHVEKELGCPQSRNRKTNKTIGERARRKVKMRVGREEKSWKKKSQSSAAWDTYHQWGSERSKKNWGRKKGKKRDARRIIDNLSTKTNW